MKPQRNWMRLQLANSPDPGRLFEVTPATIDHARALAHLMDISYTGTIDHEGETPEQCFEEIKGTVEGKYGPFVKEASFVHLDGEVAASTSLITLWKGHPLLAFSMTAPQYQGRGLAGFLIRKSLFALKLAGYSELYLVVTEGNTPAEKLYRKIGFEFIGPAIPGQGVDGALVLERVDGTAERIVQQILESAPTYTMNTEGVVSIDTDGRDTLTAIPPNCSIEQKHVLILKQRGAPVGVADLIQGYPDQETAFLGLMLLREDHQRRELGKSFYRMIEERVIQILKCKKIRLAVVDSNPVIPFWEKMGFKLTGDSKPHEGRNLKSVKRVMEKELT
jgi:ribosomal protein S18 acetylase RimI-like enzyme